MNVRFTKLDKESEKEAKNIIISGLEEHWGSYDPSFNPDITNLLKTYGANCLTAWIEDLMVGAGCWYQKDMKTAFICRMSVHSKFRNRNIGSLMLSEIEQRIKNRKYQTIELETTSEWKKVIRFYLKNGYRINREFNGDTYFIKDLTLTNRPRADAHQQVASKR